MKFDRYIVIGVIALLVAAFVTGAFLYKRNEKKTTEANVAAQMDSLVRPYSPRLGPDAAPVALVEFFDPECEACRAIHPIVKSVLAEFPGQVQLILRYMPFHNNSAYAASVLEAAREQGKFWEALDRLFERQPEWGDHHSPRPDLIVGFLSDLGLDMEKLNADIKNPEYARRVDRDRQDGMALGVRGTPTFFVNGTPLSALGEESLRQAIRAQLP